jgi:long-subunit acyl-CoA synthetase (AMP-forming)
VTGYLGNLAATRSAITPEGWFKTGDLAKVEANGYVQIVDRCKDMVRGKGNAK